MNGFFDKSFSRLLFYRDGGTRCGLSCIFITRIFNRSTSTPQRISVLRASKRDALVMAWHLSITMYINLCGPDDLLMIRGSRGGRRATVPEKNAIL